ncbi:MAG: hypothetical protein VX772_01595 [Bacteroidota bacterium]|uniref:Uncharacterized protein n=1 Tax=Flagellimonas okinawensis TaxID=3031324 RepID=A0ABT5XLX9_9FLAO|nr:hypothetical protein [[Muricauda] okinawensis]MDF0706894.1 hypothetical protein [[Muricauda] okinawensis]MEC8831025.1 hypothetical protein [Bacteroidota bacterium]
MFGKNTTAPLIVILISLVLFVLNIMELKNGNSSIWGMISNVLLIFAMVMVILDRKKKSKE